MFRITRAVIIAGVALLAVLLTCSPLWRPSARALEVEISAWHPTPPPPVAGALGAPAEAARVEDPPAALVPSAAPPPAAPREGTPPATPAPIVAQVVVATPTPGMDDIQVAGAIDTYLNDLVELRYFQGAVLVARDGHVILSKGYGMADASRGVPNTPQTRFRIASLTKQFTAAAIMLLQARGQLAVQDSICAYLDPCPDAWRAITIHHLLTHTSGLPNYTDFASYEATQAQPATPADLAARFRDLPLLFAPGGGYMYQNSDYVLLGMIVERASGQPYADFLRDAIFTPLAMRDSGVAAGVAAEGDALGYRVFGEPAPPLDPSTLFAAGALFSTVEDLFRWDQALYTTQLLPQPLLDAMWTPYATDYGYGWKVDTAFGRRRIGHPGLIDGFQTMIARYPDDRVTIIVLSNMTGADIDGISFYLASLVFGS